MGAVLILLALCCSPLWNIAVLAQPQEQSNTQVPIDSIFIATTPELQTGFDKIANTLLFRGDAQGQFVFPFATVLFRQQFRSRVIRATSEVALRDDEEADVKIVFPVSSQSSVFLQSSLRYSSDTRSIGINTLTSGNTMLGFYTAPSDKLSLMIKAGPDFNEQLGIGSSGVAVGGNLTLSPLEIDEYFFNSSISADYSRLADERLGYRFAPEATLQGSFGDGGTVALSAALAKTRRDFYTLFSVGIAGFLESPIAETREEDRFSATGTIIYPITSHWNIEAQARLDQLGVERYFRQPAANAELTLVRRLLNEERLSLQLRSLLQLPYLNFVTGLNIESRNESNGVLERFSLPVTTLEQLRQSENQRDNSSSRLQLFTSLAIPFRTHDTLLSEISATAFRYDTPSLLNNDDRDEIWFSGTLAYRRQLLEGLALKLRLEGQLRNLVFLRSQRSAQNNATYIIKLTSHFFWQHKQWNARPQFEILANYTVFDYENIVPGVKSFSFRQLSYRDTLRFFLSPKLSLQARLFARYFERGELSWGEFSEVPQDKNIELFNYLFLTYAVEDLTCSVGLRHYSLTRQPATPRASITGFGQYTLGPAVELDIPIGGSTNITVQGWYEFQFSDGRNSGQTPNVFLLAKQRW